MSEKLRPDQAWGADGTTQFYFEAGLSELPDGRASEDAVMVALNNALIMGGYEGSWIADIPENKEPVMGVMWPDHSKVRMLVANKLGANNREQ